MKHIAFLIVLVLSTATLVSLNPVDTYRPVPKVNISAKCDLKLDKKNCCCKDECKCCCCCCNGQK